jgi:hypothetical protein
MFLRALTLSELEAGDELPGHYDEVLAVRVDEHGEPVVGQATVGQTRTETKAMRDPSDADEDRAPRAGLDTVTKTAERDHDHDPLAAALTVITKTAGGRDSDRESPLALLGTHTRGRRDSD